MNKWIKAMATKTHDSRTYHRLGITLTEFTEFCQRRHITELALFGSILREDFHPDSDIDILVTFTPEAKTSLLDLVDMQYELEDLFHREVDLLTKKSVIDSPNWMRRQEILNTAKIMYESRSNLPA
jgi:predicted nucleotidyltransferase